MQIKGSISIHILYQIYKPDFSILSGKHFTMKGVFPDGGQVGVLDAERAELFEASEGVRLQLGQVLEWKESVLDDWQLDEV